MLQARDAWRGAAVVCLAVLLAGGAWATNRDTAAKTVSVRVGPAAPLTATVADSAEERAAGLMGVRRLAPRHGMIFVFDRRESQTFYMYRTLVPLSLVFVDGGRVVGVEEMSPCREDDPDRCPRYPSPSTVTHAVEAPQGFFTSAGVKVGDPMTVSELP